MIASRFRPVGWVAAVAVAALGCYLVSLRVAAKRDEVTRIETQIISTRVDMRRLETELGTRSRLVQLERWNSDALGLAAPHVGQYLKSEMQLASLGSVPETPGGSAPGTPGDGAVLQASYTAPSSAAAAAKHDAPARTVAAPAPRAHVELAVEKKAARKPRPQVTRVSAGKTSKPLARVKLAVAKQPAAIARHKVQLADKAVARQHAKAALASASLPAVKSRRKVQLAARDSDAAPLLRRASYTKVGPDRQAGLRQIALLDDEALGTIQRAARAETGGEMGGAKKKRP